MAGPTGTVTTVVAARGTGASLPTSGRALLGGTDSVETVMALLVTVMVNVALQHHNAKNTTWSLTRLVKHPSTQKDTGRTAKATNSGHQE